MGWGGGNNIGYSFYPLPLKEHSVRKTILVLLAVLLLFASPYIGQAAISQFGDLGVTRANGTGTSLSGINYRPVAGIENETTFDDQMLIFTGTDDDGTETFPDAFSAAPLVLIAPLVVSDVATTSFTVHLKTETTTGFTYEVRQDNDTATSDVTATVPVRWVAIGNE